MGQLRCLACLGLLAALAAPAWAQNGAPPLRFEIMINGESFFVDEGQLAELKSQQNPDQSYAVAVRLAQYQPWQLNTLRFDYHRGFAVNDDRTEQLRTAVLKHDLGFAMILSDLGGTLDGPGREQSLESLLRVTRQSLTGSGATEIEASEPSTRKFGPVEGYGVQLKYRQGDVPEAALVYVLTGEFFAATAVVQYVQEDQADVLDLIRPTWQSLAALPGE